MRERLPVPKNLSGFVWHFVANGGSARPSHTHAELEMNFCVRGRAAYVVRSQRVELRPNAMLWLFPKDEHELVEWSADFEMWTAVFRPALVRETRRLTGDKGLILRSSAHAPLRMMPREHAVFLAALLQELYGRAGQPLMKNSGLRFLLPLARHEFLCTGREHRGEEIHPAVERAVFAIAAGKAGKEAKSFARECGLSRARLSRLFKQQMGISLSDYRNRKRVERFQYLYGEGQRLTVLAAALEADFGSIAQFYRVYRKVTGKIPRHRRGYDEPD